MIASLYIILRNIFMPCEKFNIAHSLSFPALGAFLLQLQSFFWQLIFPLSVKVPFIDNNFVIKVAFYSCSSIIFLYFLIEAIIKKNAIIAFGLAMYFTGLLPIIGLDGTIKFLGPALSEHYVYNSSIGFCVLLAYFLLALHSHLPKFSRIVFIIVCFYFSALTVAVSYYYKNEIIYYKYVSSLEKDNSFAYIGLENAYYHNNKDYDLVIREGKKLLQAKPYDWNIYCLLGNAFTAKREFGEAIKSYQMALRLNPGTALVVYNNLGNIYTEQKKYNEALEFFNRALKIDPDYSLALMNKASLFIKNKVYDRQALVLYERILNVNPGNVNELVSAASYWSEAGYLKEAEMFLKEALRLSPRDYEASKKLGIIYGQMNDFDASLSYFKKAIEIKPQDKELKKMLDKYTKLKEASAK
jgi:tetratricopeptide (TPR) repeat protein